MSETVDEEETGTYYKEYSPGLDQWHYALLVLGGIAAFVGGILSGGAYAFGAALGSVAIYYLTIRAARAIYDRVEALQLNLIPTRIYAGICILAALVSIPGAFLMQSPGAGVFLFMYGLLGGVALFSYGLNSVV